MAEPWRATSVPKRTRRTRPSGDFFLSHKQTKKSLNSSPPQRLQPSGQPQSSQWKDWVRWQKLYSGAEMKSALVRAGNEFKGWKFLLLTHSGRVNGFPWQVLFTHLDSQPSFRKGAAPSSHRAGESCSPSSGTRVEVPALLSTSAGCEGITGVPCLPGLLVRAGQAAGNLAGIAPVSWSSKGKLQKPQLTARSCSQQQGMAGTSLTKATPAVVALPLSPYRAEEPSAKGVYFSLNTFTGDWVTHLRCELLFESHLGSLRKSKKLQKRWRNRNRTSEGGNKIFVPQVGACQRLKGRKQAPENHPCAGQKLIRKVWGQRRGYT